jgi:hypothetical protein
VLRAVAMGRRGGDPIDFEDWIRAQLASPPASAGPGAAGRLRIRAPQARPGHLLQAFTAGAAVAFFALGLMAGAPVPAMQILPAPKTQSLPVTSLGVAPVPAPAAEAPAASTTAVATPRTTRHRFDRRTDGARTYSRQSPTTIQPRTGTTSSSSPRPSRPTR